MYHIYHNSRHRHLLLLLPWSHTTLIAIAIAPRPCPWLARPHYYSYRPELWCGAAGLCARERACAGAAESLHTYIPL